MAVTYIKFCVASLFSYCDPHVRIVEVLFNFNFNFNFSKLVAAKAVAFRRKGTAIKLFIRLSAVAVCARVPHPGVDSQTKDILHIVIS